MSATAHLQKQYKELTQRPLGGFRVELVDSDIFTWTVWFSGPKGSLYEGGQYRAQLRFPQEFPFKPPEMRIVSDFWHPNVYPDGRVCISILHPPGEDEMNSLETAQMRWTPVQSVEKILVSVVSLLSDPDSSDAGAPANVDALVMYRKQRPQYIRRCRELAEKSVSELPLGWKAPPEQDAAPAIQKAVSAYGDSVVFEEPEEAPSEPYAAELQQIRSMGVATDKSDEELMQLLTKNKGDVSRVLETLW